MLAFEKNITMETRLWMLENNMNARRECNLDQFNGRNSV